MAARSTADAEAGGEPEAPKRFGAGRLWCLLDGNELDGPASMAATTMHGLNHAVGSKSPRRQCLWSVVVFAALVGLATLLIDKTSTFLSNPTSTVLTLKNPTRVRFPAVTVCNNQPFSITNAQGGPFEGTVNNSQAPAPFTEAQASKAGFSREDTFMNPFACTFNYHLCRTSDMLHSWDSEYGNCWTFNADNVPMQLESYVGSEPPVWYGNTSDDKLMSSRASEDAGLTLAMNVQSADYPSASPSLDSLARGDYLYAAKMPVGIRFFVHDPTQDYASHGGATGLAPPGFATTVAVQRQTFQLLPKPWGDCEPTLSPTDSVRQCLLDCVDAFMRRSQYACAWLPPFGGDHPEPCMVNAAALAEGLDATSLLSNSQSAAKSCDCRNRCDAAMYPSVSITAGRYPSQTTLESLRNSGQVPNETGWAERNMVLLKVSLATLQVLETNTTKAYTFTSLLSDYGGQLGLFAGISVLTLVELSEALWTRCCAPRRERRRLLRERGGSRAAPGVTELVAPGKSRRPAGK